MRRRRGEGGRGGECRAECEHDALADPIDYPSPADERDHHAEAGQRRHQPSLGEVEASLGMQRGDHEGHAVDEDVGAQGRGQRDRQHRPSAHGADRGRRRGHADMVTRHVSRCRTAISNNETRYDETAHDPRSADVGPAVDGVMSKSKIAVGRYSEQQALGMSTTPLTLPSIGAAPSSR